MMSTLGVFSLSIIIACAFANYEPNWDSLNKRPLPPWYDEAKFGIFIHWGVFSVPSFGSEWFWHNWASGSKSYVDFMKANYPPHWTYADFASQFTAEFYNPDEWADIFQASGAKYIVLTSKHHEGFCNWNTKVSFNWNSVEVGPKRDLVGDLAKSIRNKTDIKFGLYHSLFEWYNPLYLADRATDFTTQNFVNGKTLPELYEIVNNYKPEVIWSDGSDGPDTYFKSTEFLAWLYNSSPVKDTVVTNDRWGDGCSCKNGGYWTCSDRFNPGHVLPHKWENCMTIDRGSWGYRRNTQLSDYLSTSELVTELVETVSCGGNLLMNVGPTHDGRIVPVFEERLRDMGAWLKVNGEAIYASMPWKYQKENATKGIWYTAKKDSMGTSVYAITLNWPSSDLHLVAPSPTSGTMVTLLGYPDEIKWSKGPGAGMTLKIPTIPFNKMPCQWAWVFKMTNLM